MNKKLTFLSLLCFYIAINSGTIAQINVPETYFEKQKPTVSVLGVFHFDNPGLDDYKPQFPFNIFKNERKKELETLLKQLARFKPTKIVIEVSRLNDTKINERYQSYLKGGFDIDKYSSEVYQIGFKLARMLGHNSIHASDHQVGWCGEDLDWDNFNYNAYRDSLGQQEKYIENTSMYYMLSYRMDSLKAVQTLSEHMKLLSNPETARLNHSYYLTGTVLTGAGDNYTGGDSVSRWYRRNLHIYSNIYDITDNQEDRILVIYGAGHLHILRQLFKDSPIFNYQEITRYLEK